MMKPRLTIILTCVILYSIILQLSAVSLRVIDLISSSPRLLVPYHQGLEWQTKLMNYHIQRSALNEERIVGSLVLLQHTHVYTLGSSTTTDGEPSAASSEGLKYDIVRIERGGQATYHGPGQIVVNPIIDLHHFQKDINAYLRRLEEVIIASLQRHDLHATTIPGLTGVWINDSKIAAIGIKLRRWGESTQSFPFVKDLIIVSCPRRNRDQPPT